MTGLHHDSRDADLSLFGTQHSEFRNLNGTGQHTPGSGVPVTTDTQPGAYNAGTIRCQSSAMQLVGLVLLILLISLI